MRDSFPQSRHILKRLLLEVEEPKSTVWSSTEQNDFAAADLYILTYVSVNKVIAGLPSPTSARILPTRIMLFMGFHINICKEHVHLNGCLVNKFVSVLTLCRSEEIESAQ